MADDEALWRGATFVAMRHRIAFFFVILLMAASAVSAEQVPELRA
jgi:hypothetical protein